MVVCSVSVARAPAQEGVSQTVHNLSVSGPGTVRAQSETQVCIFCHAPHNTSGVSPLWNRDLPVSSYSIYQSSTLDAIPGRPTGSSKLCLSCHDGTIALGSVISRQEKIRMVGGDFIPPGLMNLGTDLSNDHPISFYYTSGLAASDSQLVNPVTLPAEVKLDATGQFQCTSCHDPHHNQFGKFMVLSREFGALCTACHNMNGWDTCSHRTSNASIEANPSVDWPFANVAQNACRSCHQPHHAAGNERLLIFKEEEENCLDCHDGTIARTNIAAEIDKTSAHDPRSYQDIHDPAETQPTTRTHVECSDCHNPHHVTQEPPSGSYSPIGTTLKGVPGVNVSGAVVQEAAREYEVCFKCHADTAARVTRRVARQSQTDNMRLKFSPSNTGFHPLVISSPSDATPSLTPGMSRGSLIQCTDCHNNDRGSGGGGSGPNGPHGSDFDFLLERNYTVQDNVNESGFEYAMCYKCHQRSSILSDQSFPEHRRHIVDEHAPCSACHDPHGVSSVIPSTSDHTHLINFDITIVRPHSSRLEYKDLGRFAGSCTLLCHGAAHHNLTYGIDD